MTEGRINVERRKDPRFSIALKVEYQVVGSAGKRVSKTGDISAGGVCVYSKAAAEVGDQLTLNIDLGEGRAVEAEAVVMWVKHRQDAGEQVDDEYILGLKFSKIRSEDSGFVAQFVQKCLMGK